MAATVEEQMKEHAEASRAQHAAVGWLLLAAALTVGFANNFVEMWSRWFPAWRHEEIGLYDRLVEGASYYTHAPLVPLVSLLFLALVFRHQRLVVSPTRTVGFLVLGSSLLVHLASCLARVNFVSGFAFVGVLIGLVLILWGRRALRHLWFALVFLVFMVPLPEVSIARLNFRLKMIATDWGVILANLLGILAEQSGNRVFLTGDKSLVVANVCNGLRTLISVIGFGALYAYVCRLPMVWRGVLLALSIPIAVIVNVVRIYALIAVANTWTVEAATGWFHDLSGLLVLLLAFGILIGLERLILWGYRMAGRPIAEKPLFAQTTDEPTDERHTGMLIRAVGSPRGWASIVLVAIFAAGAVWLSQSVPSRHMGTYAAKALPTHLSPDGEEWQSYRLPIDRKSLMILETEDAVVQRYMRPQAPPVDICIVFSPDNRKGTHPPELCLEGVGVNIIGQRDLDLELSPGQSLPCREIIVQSGADRTYYVYTYKCGNQHSASFWTQQFVIFRNGLLRRDASGALIRISTPILKDLETARQRAWAFMRAATPHLDSNLP